MQMLLNVYNLARIMTIILNNDTACCNLTIKIPEFMVKFIIFIIAAGSTVGK